MIGLIVGLRGEGEGEGEWKLESEGVGFYGFLDLRFDGFKGLRGCFG